jgi:hypothetical protein
MDNPAAIGIVFLAITQIAGFLLTMKKLSGVSESRRIEPQPLEVKPSPEYMTRADCTRMHAQNERFEGERFDQLNRRLTELTVALERRNQEGESRAARIHTRVDECAKEIARIDGTLNNHIEHGAHNA